MIIELDMAKAYDSLLVLSYESTKRMGFSKLVVDLIWRLISNNWYSMLINGQAHRFFHSTRRVKQDDLLFPNLFILSAKVLSRVLNASFDDDL